MGDTKAKFTDTRTGFIDILMCRYEDERLALWMKIVFCFIWIVSIPNGLIYGVDTDYIMRWNLSRGFSAKHNVSENSVQNICRAVSPQRMRIIGSMVFFYL